MKAAVLEDKGVISYKDVPTPQPRPGHVLIKVAAVSICGSDIKRFAQGHRTYPMILGHECAGVVETAGAGVDPRLIGRHVAVIPLVPCFECEQCRLGLYSACRSYSFIGSRQDGGFAEYVEVPERNLLPVPDEIGFEAAALVEPSTVARHMLDLGGFAAGQTAMVFGAGSIGGMILMSFILGLPLHFTAGRFDLANKGIRWCSGLFSVGLGVFIVYEKLISA